jgi:hypothetical protein
MSSHLRGVRVRRVEPTSPVAKFVQQADVLLSFDGISIANDGTGKLLSWHAILICFHNISLAVNTRLSTVSFRHGERIGFSYLVSQKYVGEHARIGILRNSAILYFDIQLQPRKHLIPMYLKDRSPCYYIIGGIVFTPVSVPYLRSEVYS